MQQRQQDQFNDEVQEFELLQVDPKENCAHASYFRGRKAVQHVSHMPYKCIGKIVCVQYGQCGQAYFQYGSAFKVAQNIAITVASVLVSRKTNTIFKQIFYYPSELLSQHGQFDFQKSRGLKVTNFHISHSYFGQLKDNIINGQLQEAMADVAICELKEKEDSSGYNRQWLKINFQYKFDSKAKYQDEALICGFSQHQNDQRHVLYAQKKPILSQDKDGSINYQHTTYNGYEGAPIIVRSKEGCYQVVGMHKCREGNLNKGILLKQFFGKYERWVEYQIRNQVKIDFHELLKNSFNKLPEKLFIDACNYKQHLTQRQATIQNLQVQLFQKSLQLEERQLTIDSLMQKSQQQPLLICEHQHTIKNLQDQFHLQSQQSITQINLLQTTITQLQQQHQNNQQTIKTIQEQVQIEHQQLQRLPNRQGTMNAQVIRLKNQRLRTLQRENRQLKEDNCQLRTSLKEITDRMAIMEAEREMRNRLLSNDLHMERLKQRINQDLNLAISQNLRNLQSALEAKISQLDNKLTTIHLTITQQRFQAQQSTAALTGQLKQTQQILDAVKEQLRQERQLSSLLGIQNSNLRQILDENELQCHRLKWDKQHLEQKESQNSKKINQMFEELNLLRQQQENHHTMLRNPQPTINAIQLLYNPIRSRSKPINKTIPPQIHVPSNDVANNRMIREEQKQKQPLQQTIVEDINDNETEAYIQSMIQKRKIGNQDERIVNPENNQHEQQVQPQPQGCQLLKNIFSLFGRQSSGTKLQQKLNQIKQLYQQELKLKHNLQPAIDYVKQVYKPKTKSIFQFIFIKDLPSSQIPDKYFKNFKERIERNLKDHQLKLTENGYNLYLENVEWNVNKFFQYDWVNLQFLCLIECKVGNDHWKDFCQKAEIFLPNLKALYISPSEITDVTEENLMSFWSVERIWFSKTENNSQLSENEQSKQQIKRFIQNKKAHHQFYVKVVY